MKRHAREMRRAPTRAEDRMWAWLRDQRFDGHKFRRQVPMGPYILDFYCARLKLAIELDGEHHSQVDMSEYDGRRSKRLAVHGIYVLRISNQLLTRDSQIVAETIRCTIRLLAERATPHPPEPALSEA